MLRALLVAVLLLLAGCGGGGDGERNAPAPAPEPAARPQANEPLSAAAARLSRALPGRDCKVLIRLMLQSVQRGGTKPDTPATKRECAYIKREAHNELRGFRVTKVREFGPAGFTEGRGANPRPGEVVGILWLLDSDGSWKAAYEAIFRPQIGVAPFLPARADSNARRLVADIRSGACADLWRVLNVSSRFVRSSGGAQQRFCRRLPAAYRDPRSAFAQIKADPSASLEPLGRTHDFSFYGLRLRNGRYMDLVLSGPLAGVAPDELKQHDNPTALEFVTVRQGN